MTRWEIFACASLFLGAIVVILVGVVLTISWIAADEAAQRDCAARPALWTILLPLQLVVFGGAIFWATWGFWR